VVVKFKRSYIVLNTFYADRLVKYALQGRKPPYLEKIAHEKRI